MKKRYRKPDVKKVQLVASEAVLQACKNPVATSGPAGFECRMMTSANQCSAWGS